MKKFYKVFLLIIIFFFLSTYSPSELNPTFKKDNIFFKITDIKVTNTFLIKKSEIFKKLDKIYNKNIFLIKKKDIKEPLEKIDFLSKIEVKKKYPGTLIVKIFETKPVAVLFKEKDMYLLDSSSNLIVIKENMNLDKYPKVFGNEAEKNFMFFFNQLKKKNFQTKEIKNYYFFQIGRWDLQLLNDKIIKFPFDNVEKAIVKSIELLKRKDFENYKIIDLRIDGKIIAE